MDSPRGERDQVQAADTGQRESTLQAQRGSSADAPLSSDGELDLFLLLLVLRRRFLRIVVFAFLGFACMAVYTLMVKPRFTALATIIVPQKSSNASSALQAAVGGELNLAGGGNEVYADILHSRTVKESLVKKFGLQDHYRAPTLEAAEQILSKQTVVTVEREGLISVSVSDTDPRLAADLANAYFAELDRVNQHLAVTAAGQERVYFGSQMVAEKDALADAEVALEKAQQRGGVLSAETQSQAGLSAVEQTRAELRALQVQLVALEQGATAQNPEVIRLRTQIAGVESQLQAMQSGGSTAAGVALSRMPAQNLDAVRASREVKFHETLFDMLARQYESAREREARDISSVEVLDPAQPALRKSWPPRTLYCLIGFVVGALLGILATLVQSVWQAVLANPENRARSQALLRGDSSAPASAIR